MALNERARRFLRNQTCAEVRHRGHFRNCLSAFGRDQPELAARQMSHHFRAMRWLIGTRRAAGDFAAGILGNNIMVEGLALNLIAAACPDLRANSHKITNFLDVVLPDERMHVGYAAPAGGERHSPPCRTARLLPPDAPPPDRQPLRHRRVMGSMSSDVPAMDRRMTVFFADQLAAAHLQA